MSSTTIATQYLNDQLQEDLKRDERVAAGVLTLGQAQRQADEWAEVSCHCRKPASYTIIIHGRKERNENFLQSSVAEI